MDLREIDTPKKKARPFLRWVGGKRWFTRTLDSIIHNLDFNDYYEPFMGGCSIYFHLSPKVAYLSDTNERLVSTYQTLAIDANNVIENLKLLKNSKVDYYKIRNKNFNSESKKAAQFIYLNQTSFNGIYRVNKKGEYNVPYGYRKNLNLNYSNLLLVSDVLKNVNFKCCDFNDALVDVKENDLVFIDPPYTVTHNDNGFFHYNKNLFSVDDQYRLSKAIDRIKSKGAFYILTNAAHSKIKDIFNKNDKMIEIERASLIGGRKAKRGQFAELIVTNIQ